MPLSLCFLRPLALLLVLAPACSRSASVPQPNSAPASAQVPAAPPARAVVRAYTLASPETIRLTSELASDQEHAPSAVDYPSLDIARDSIGAIVRRTVSPAEATIRLNGSPARLQYWYTADSVDGWAFHIVVADTSDCLDNRVKRALQAAGWAPAWEYSADGADGSVMGFVTNRFLCVVEGRWDGGDATDSTYVPQPGCEVTVTCVPRRGDGVPGRGAPPGGGASLMAETGGSNTGEHRLAIDDPDCSPGECICRGRVDLRARLNETGPTPEELLNGVPCVVADFDGAGALDYALPGAEGTATVILSKPAGGFLNAIRIDAGGLMHYYPPRKSPGPDGEPPSRLPGILVPWVGQNHAVFLWDGEGFARTLYPARSW